MISFIIIGLTLMISFGFLFYAQKQIYDYMDVYPVVNCKEIREVYGTSLNHYAILEWHFLRE